MKRGQTEMKIALLQSIRNHPTLAISRIIAIEGLSQKAANLWLRSFVAKGLLNELQKSKRKHYSLTYEGAEVLRLWARTKEILKVEEKLKP